MRFLMRAPQIDDVDDIEKVMPVRYKIKNG
jgi:hypothetical protein